MPKSTQRPTMARRQLIRLHTFVPDAQDIDGWVPRLAAWNQGNDALSRRYAEAYVTPDAAKTRKFIHDTNFYTRNDAVIRLVRALHRGELADPGELESAVKKSASQSQYAQALGRGLAGTPQDGEVSVMRYRSYSIAKRVTRLNSGRGVN